MGDAGFVDRFGDAARFGAYFRIVREGDVGAGDEIEMSPRADGITVTELGRALHTTDVELLDRIARDPAVPESWRDWAARRRVRQ